MNTDFNYCSGVTCPIRKECKRYLPNPPDMKLHWVSPAYDGKAKLCPLFTVNDKK